MYTGALEKGGKYCFSFPSTSQTPLKRKIRLYCLLSLLGSSPLPYMSLASLPSQQLRENCQQIPVQCLLSPGETVTKYFQQLSTVKNAS